MATVNIWYPKLRTRQDIKQSGFGSSPGQHGVYQVVSNVGHASLTLDRCDPPNYISWWPDESHQSYYTPTFLQDVELERCGPTVSVDLDFLDERSISSWWERVKLDGLPIPWRTKFHPADIKWTLERSNCSHMVLLALEVGGAEKNATILKWGSSMITPPQIHFYAMRLKVMAALPGGKS